MSCIRWDLIPSACPQRMRRFRTMFIPPSGPMRILITWNGSSVHWGYPMIGVVRSSLVVRTTIVGHSGSLHFSIKRGLPIRRKHPSIGAILVVQFLQMNRLRMESVGVVNQRCIKRILHSGFYGLRIMRTNCLPISKSCLVGLSGLRRCRRTGLVAVRASSFVCLLLYLRRRFLSIRHAQIRRSELRSWQSHLSIHWWRRSVRSVIGQMRFVHSACACANSPISSVHRANRKKKESSPVSTA